MTCADPAPFSEGQRLGRRDQPGQVRWGERGCRRSWSCLPGEETWPARKSLKGEGLDCVYNGDPKDQRLSKMEKTAQNGCSKLPVSGGMLAKGGQPLSYL